MKAKPKAVAEKSGDSLCFQRMKELCKLKDCSVVLKLLDIMKP